MELPGKLLLEVKVKLRETWIARVILLGFIGHAQGVQGGVAGEVTLRVCNVFFYQRWGDLYEERAC